MKPLRHSPALVRQVLADAETTSCYAAAQRAGLTSRTVYRWQARRTQNPSWPTDQEIAEWVDRDRATAAERARKAAQKRDWLKRRAGAGGGLMMIDSLGTTRRLRALYAIGWTAVDLGPRIGFSPGRVGHLVSGRQAKIHRHTAARIEAVFDDLCMTVPQDPDVPDNPRTIRVHDRQRRQSALKGWAPPLAWDDIDDPTSTPSGHLHGRTDARAAELEDLLEHGADLWDVLATLEMTRNTFNTWCVRHGYRQEYLDLAAKAGARVNSPGNQHSERRAS